MATHKKIKKATVHYLTKENEEKFQRRAVKSVAQVLFEMYLLYVIDKKGKCRGGLAFLVLKL